MNKLMLKYEDQKLEDLKWTANNISISIVNISLVKDLEILSSGFLTNVL